MNNLSKSCIAEKLANHPDRNARAKCATFTWISQELLETLSKDKWSIVRLCTAMNRSTSKLILESLTKDVAPHVQEAARDSLDFQSKTAVQETQNEPRYDVLIQHSAELSQQLKSAQKSDLSPTEIRDLMSSSSEWVRANLAYPFFTFTAKLTEPKSLRLGLEDIIHLSKDESGIVRAALARNPLVPKEILETFAGDPDSRVTDMLASNSSTPNEILVSMLNSDDWRVWVPLTENAAIAD